MKKTATFMAACLLLAAVSPLSACGSKSAAEVYTEVRNAALGHAVGQTHAVFYEEELYNETATSIKRHYNSYQDNVSKEKNLYSSLNVFRRYTATKNSAGEIASETERVSTDYTTVRQFGGIWYRTTVQHSTEKTNGEITSEDFYYGYVPLPDFETNYSAVSMVLDNAVTHGGWSFEIVDRHVLPEMNKNAVEAYELCLAEDIVAEQAKDPDIVVNFDVSHKDQNGTSVVAFNGTMNRARNDYRGTGRSDYTSREVLKAKKGKIVEVERFMEENFVSPTNASKNFKQSEWTHTTYSDKFNQKWFDALEVYDVNNVPEEKQKYVYLSSDPMNVYVKTEMPVVIWPGKWNREFEVPFTGYGSTPAEVLASLEAEAFPSGYQQFFLDKECTQPVPTDISIRDWNNIEKLYIAVPTMSQWQAVAVEYVTNKYSSLPAHRLIMGLTDITTLHGVTYLNTGSTYTDLEKPSYADEWIIYDEFSEPEGFNHSGDAYSVNEMQLLIYESIRNHTTAGSIIESFFTFHRGMI